jgi:hypothetical protein
MESMDTPIPIHSRAPKPTQLNENQSILKLKEQKRKEKFTQPTPDGPTYPDPLHERPT